MAFYKKKFEQSEMGLDQLFMATTLFRHRRFEDCLEICNQFLTKNPKDQVKEDNGVFIGCQCMMVVALVTRW